MKAVKSMCVCVFVFVCVCVCLCLCVCVCVMCMYVKEGAKNRFCAQKNS